MKILMVCLGNICRSPIAEGIMRKKASDKKLKVMVDSAGTSDWHEGEHPDPRAVRTAKKFGVDISKLRARPFTVKDFTEFDRIFVMDSGNYADVTRLAKNDEETGRVQLLMEALHPGSRMHVPDPYYGGEQEFEEVFRMMEEACDSIASQLLESIK